jgi:hypothetical protein
VRGLPQRNNLPDARYRLRDEHHTGLAHFGQLLVGGQFPPPPIPFERSNNVERQPSRQGEIGEEVVVGLEILLGMY